MSGRLGKNLIFFRNLLMEGSPEERGKQGWHIRLTACYVWIWRAAFAFLAIFLILMFFSFLHLVAKEKRRRSALPWAGGESLYSLHSSPPVCLTIIFTDVCLFYISSFIFSSEVSQSASPASSQWFVIPTFCLYKISPQSASQLSSQLLTFLSHLVLQYFFASSPSLSQNHLHNWRPIGDQVPCQAVLRAGNGKEGQGWGRLWSHSGEGKEWCWRWHKPVPPLVFELTTGKSYIGALHTQTPLFWWPTHCHICNFLLLLEHTYQYDDDIDGPHLQSVKFLCLQTVLFLIQSDHCLVLSICPWVSPSSC